MANYEDTYDKAKEFIQHGWTKYKSKPRLFARVMLTFGEKYMIDYEQTQFRDSVDVIENLNHRIEEICSGSKPTDPGASTQAAGPPPPAPK